MSVCADYDVYTDTPKATVSNLDQGFATAYESEDSYFSFSRLSAHIRFGLTGQIGSGNLRFRLEGQYTELGNDTTPILSGSGSIFYGWGKNSWFSFKAEHQTQSTPLIKST